LNVRTASAALLACLSLLPAVRAGESPAHVADLSVGPLVSGQPVRLELRTTLPSALFGLFYGTDGTPTLAGQLPPLGVNLAGPFNLVLGFTDAAGRFEASWPSAPGSFGPAGTGAAFFFHAVVIDSHNHKRAGNVTASEVEPLPPAPGFLADDAAARLPAGYDSLGGVAIEASDITRDGYPDLLIATDLAVAVWVNDGTGAFADESARLPHPGDALSTLRAGDLDGDGDFDVVTGGGYDPLVSPPNRLWLNDGAGQFADDPAFPAGEGLASCIELADLDGDSLPEVLFGNGAEVHLAVPGGRSELLINVPSIGFVPDLVFEAAAWNDSDYSTTGARAGDIDSDGDLDLYLCRQDTSAIDARFLDLDGDLDLDLVVANSVFGVPTTSSNDVLINQGGLQGGVEGAFADDPASFLEASLPGDGIRLSVHGEDVDADGDADVLVTTHDLFAGADQMLFLNQGGAQHGLEGAFVRASWFDPPFSGTGGLGDFICFAAAVFDADQDGDREVVLCGAGVVTADPQDQFTTRFLLNGKL
jgi:hypothetical protein